MVNTKIFLNLLVSGALVAIASASLADVFKWVDKDGKTHYTDQPPIGSDAKKLKRKTTDTPTAAPAAAAKDVKPATSVADQELDYRKRKTEKEETEKKQKAEADVARQNKEYCNSLKGDLRSHSDGTRVIRYNDKGERVYLDEKEHADSKRNLEDRMAKECK